MARIAKTIPILIAVAFAPVLGACKRQDQIGSITQYTRGAGSSGGAGDASEPPPSGVIVLENLFAGALLGKGPPEVGTFAPADGEGGVLPTTPVVCIFSESIDPKTVSGQTVQLRPETDNPFEPPVPAAVLADPESAMRMVLLLPAQPLDFGASYVAQIGAGVKDLEGNPVTQGGASGPFGVPTGGATARFTTFVPGAFGPQPVFGPIAMFPPPGDDSAEPDTTITLVFNAPVDESTLSGAFFVEAAGMNVGGDLELDADPRVLRFTPDHPFPMGAKVTVRLLESVRSESLPGLGPLPMVAPFEETFETNSVPAPTGLELVGNAPLTIAGLAFDGRLTSENLDAFAVDVFVPAGKPSAERTTLLFFQPKGEGEAAARAFAKDKGQGTVGFVVDLSKGDDASAFVDSDETDPPAPVFVGAFAQRGGLRSAVGPPELARVFVKVSKPDVALGPPFDEQDPYSFRTLLRDPAITGRATEPIASLRVIVQAVTDPTTFDGIALGPAGVLTNDDLLFATSPGEAALAGGTGFGGPRFLPVEIDEIVVTDPLGNRRRVRDKAGSIRFEGQVGGPLEPDATEDLRVRVVRASDLMPIAGATVRVEPFPYDPANAALVRLAATDGGGEAVFQDLGALGPRILVTAFDQGFDLLTLAGLENPAFFAHGVGVSLPLRESQAADLVLGADVQTGLSPGPGPAYRAMAGSLARPASPSAVFPDARFSLVPLGLPGAEVSLAAPPDRPFLATLVDHDGAGQYAFAHTSLRFTEKDEDLPFDFTGGALADAFVSVDFSPADVTAAGIAEDPIGRTRGRLVARLPGLPGVLPLSIAAEPIQPPDGEPARIVVPLPPTLLRDEPPGGDPAYEVFLQPSGALPGLPPVAAELEEGLRVEVEAAETATARFVRHRIGVDLTLPAPGSAAPVEAPALPPVPLVQKTPGSGHPPSLDLDLGAGPAPFDPDDSVVLVEIAPQGGGRIWRVWLGGEAAGLSPVTLALPDVGVAPFDAAGTYTALVTGFEFPPGGFDFDAFAFADVERDHRRAARSALLTFETLGP